MSMMWSESFDMPLRGRNGYIKNILEQIEEENEKKYRKQLEEREKLNMLLNLSKEQIEALTILANNYILKDKIGD